MLIVLSPAKSLDFVTPVKIKANSLIASPALIDDAAALIEIVRQQSPQQLADLMQISPMLAQLNAERFAQWSTSTSGSESRPAVFAFDGDVYEGLDAHALSLPQLKYLQNHLRILSGLYGVLKPLDAIHAYRLEMGRALQNSRGGNLYQFWGRLVTDAIDAALSEQKYPVLVNLASEEYFKVIKPGQLNHSVITPVFQEWKNDHYKIISFFAKRARGLMARYCALHKIERVEKLKAFDLEGYQFDEKVSNAAQWVFRRRAA